MGFTVRDFVAIAAPGFLIMAGTLKVAPFPSAKVHQEMVIKMNQFYDLVWNFAPLNKLITSGTNLRLLVGCTEAGCGALALTSGLMGWHSLQTLALLACFIPVSCAVVTHVNQGDGEWPPALVISLIILYLLSTSGTASKAKQL